MPRCVQQATVVLTLTIAAALEAQPIRPVAGVPTPSAHTGLDIGADRGIADWPQITGYFEARARARPQQMQLDTLGVTTQGKPVVVAAISSPRNIARLEETRAGMQMQYALEAAGKTGVGDGVTYDLWWHGGTRSTPTRHNMVGLLTEAASAAIATPITQRMEDLTGHPRGLLSYERNGNFPNPWLGGTWRLRDIMDYE